MSGSLDGKLRLWNIPDKKVALWNEVDGQTKLITAANFCQNGKYAVIGTYDGRCIFYDTEVSPCFSGWASATRTLPRFHAAWLCPCAEESPSTLRTPSAESASACSTLAASVS